MKHRFAGRVAAIAQASLLALGANSLQAQTSPTAPDAGRLLDSVRPGVRADLPDTGSGLRVPDQRKRVSGVRGGARIDVASYRISGVERLPAGIDAGALLAPYIGPGKSFDDIEQAAEALQTAIRASGLFLAQVDVPAQRVAGGVVELRVLEGRIDRISLKPLPEGLRVRREAIEPLLGALKPGDVISADSVERALFLAGDLRGVSLNSVIVPGASPGSAAIEVEASPGRAFQGSVDIDNLGSVYTGRTRLAANIELNSPFGRGDLFKLTAQGSTTGGLVFLRGVYQSNVGASGLKLGVAGSWLAYRLGTAAFGPLNAQGEASVLSAFALYPIQRGRNSNLFVQAGLDRRQFVDEQRAVAIRATKHSDVLQVALVGDRRDAWWTGGISNYSLGLTAGRLSIDSAAQLAADQAATGRQTHGGYTKVNYALARQQLLWTSPENNRSRLVLFGSLQGQFASKNLDSSEKFSLGGPTGVRAYPQGEAAGDGGHLLTWELRKNILRDGLDGDLVVSLFGDYGVAQLNRRPLPTDTPNRRALRGHGIGVTFAQPDGWFIKASVAWRGKEAVQSDTRDTQPRLFIQASRAF